MPVGNTATSGTVNLLLSNLSTQLRDLMEGINDLSTWITGQGNGLAYLEYLGYSSASNPNNPGSVSDAQLALNMINYLNTVAGVYYGTATQGTQFNFNQELSQLWAGQ